MGFVLEWLLVSCEGCSRLSCICSVLRFTALSDF